MKIFFVVFSFLFFLSFSQANASSHTVKLSESDTGSDSANVIEEEGSQYILAYPGMLPDNPLYKIKVLRDKIISFLINEPLKKIDFYLLQADKGMLASAMLVEKGSDDIAAETALKAEHNMTLIVTQLTRLQSKPEGSLFDKLQQASEKHQELLMKSIQNTEGEAKKSLEAALDFSKRNLETLSKYSKKDPKKWTDWS